MTLNQVIYFQAIARTGNLRQAAEELFIAQSSLSTAIRNLEKDLGVPLFIHAHQQLKITREGEAFLEHANIILRDVDEARIHMRRLAENHEHELRIGCIPPLMHHYFPQKMQQFMQLSENLHLHFSFQTNDTPELVRGLKAGLYDLLICSESDDPELRQVMIQAEPLVFLTPLFSGDEPREIISRKLISETVVPDSWESLSHLPLIGYKKGSVMDRALENLAKEQQITLDFRYRAPGDDDIRTLVDYHFGYAIVPRSQAISATLRQCPLPSEVPARKIFLTSLKSQALYGAAGRFEKFLIVTDSENP
ncbi:LysR family transcriptional regulator [Clostridium vitabionis]|uniref:LysR family transcriptional regulator n=1 Tax=Clostridium vitabionis TaxID=2784388 RepID=UPI00188BCD9A|nr:LysR family transcriptional regulator [Clostridium vitabionis]